MLFSVLIPAFKGQFLSDAIDSCLAQDYDDFEVIIVDDHSPDNLHAIVSNYSDKRIRYYSNRANCGAVDVVDNWNICLSYAEGDFVICMGDDDRLLPWCLTEYRLLLQKYPNLDIYHARTELIDEKGEFINLQESSPETEQRVCAPTDKQLFRALLTSNICHQAMFFRTELLLVRGYDETFCIYADWRRNVELLMAATRWELLPAIVCRYELGGLSDTMNQVVAAEYQRVVDAYPQGVVNMIQELPELEMYRSIRYYQYLRSLLDGNRLVRNFTKATILLLYKLFAKR